MFFYFFSGNRLWQLMFRYLCFVKEPGLMLATNTSTYLQEKWFNCCWLETVISIVIVSFSAVFMSYVRILTVIPVAADDCSEVCMNSVCVLSERSHEVCLGIEWPGFISVSTVLQLITVCSVTLCTSTLNLFLGGFMIFSLLPSRPHFVKFFFWGVVTYQ